MSQRTYRISISIIAVWAALSIPTVLLPALLAMQAGEQASVMAWLLPLGFALLPVSVVGLWHLRPWGLIVLGVSFVVVVVAYSPGGCVLHAICVVLTISRYVQIQREARAGQSAG